MTRVSTTIVLIVMMISMIVTVDGFALVNLIIFKYKFITLRNYFEKLRTDFDKLLETGYQRIAAEKFEKKRNY